MERVAASVLSSPEIVQVGGAAGRVPGWEDRFTARRLLRLEERLTTGLTDGRHVLRGLIPASVVEAVLTDRPTLGADQADAVRRLTSQGNGIEVLVGRAGTGKTSTLAAVADAYRRAGWEVIGVAPSARAARELEDGAAIASYTVPRFAHRISRDRLTARSIVVVDEAGMARTDDLTFIVDAARRARAKSVLVGDPRQLPEIGPGGGLSAAAKAASRSFRCSAMSVPALARLSRCPQAPHAMRPVQQPCRHLHGVATPKTGVANGL